MTPPSFVSNLTLRLYADEARRRAATRLAARYCRAMHLLARPPDRLVVAPTDLRPGDAFVAEDIYAGRFALAGRVLDTQGASPFLMDMPSAQFAHALHAFAWLRHCRAADHPLALANARALTDDWIAMCGRRAEGAAWLSDTAAQRVIAWLSHSPVVMRGADRAFQRRFLRSLATQVRYLDRIAATAPDGVVRFRVRIALAMASLALPYSDRAIRAAARHLDQEIDRQILPDGGHVSRDSGAGLDLLVDLLPLRQTYANLSHGAPARLIPAIDRMFPALRFFRHADGHPALFNGATATPAQSLMSVLRYDESAGAAFRQLPHTRYQRLSAGGTVVICDVGPPPPAGLSARAHGGCLSFELSFDRHRLVVNAGRPVFADTGPAHLARATAAHSTVTLGNTSSVRLSRSPYLGALVTQGVGSVSLAMADGADGARSFTARHDGYADRFGLYHERRLRLSPDGRSLTGADRFFTHDDEPPADGNRTEAVARFHIHPQTAVSRGRSGDVIMATPDGHRWSFFCLDAEPEVDEDIFFADTAGARTSRQITLTFTVGETPEIQWTFSRLTG